MCKREGRAPSPDTAVMGAKEKFWSLTNKPEVTSSALVGHNYHISADRNKVHEIFHFLSRLVGQKKFFLMN